MSDLHPIARSLIANAKKREAGLPEEVRGRVHRSVLGRAAALAAAAVVTTSASVAAKTSALAGALAGPLVAAAALSGLAGAAFLVAAAVSRPPGPVSQAPLSPATERFVRPSPSPSAALTPEPAPARIAEVSAAEPAARAANGGTDRKAPSALRPTPAPALTPAKTSDREEPEANAMRAPGLVGAPARIAQDAPGPAPSESPAQADPDRESYGGAGAAPSRAGSRSPAPVANALAAEVDLLRQVHAALRARQADRALALLDRIGGTVDPGPLDEEAQAARVSALCQLGREGDARLVIARFVARWPGSPLATRLQSGCAAIGATGDDRRN